MFSPDILLTRVCGFSMCSRLRPVIRNVSFQAENSRAPQLRSIKNPDGKLIPQIDFCFYCWLDKKNSFLLTVVILRVSHSTGKL